MLIVVDNGVVLFVVVCCGLVLWVSSRLIIVRWLLLDVCSSVV